MPADASTDVMTDIATIVQRSDEDGDVKSAATEILTLFTARMQHHFARGPFSKELRKRLIAAEEMDLAETAYQYFLAANVLKHGTGSSYHELRKIKGLPFGMKQPDGSGQVTGDLVDVTSDGFLENLVATLDAAKRILEAD